LEIPRKLEWEELESLTHNVKKETRHPNFDRALGNFSKHGENVEVIRIYAPDMDEEVIKEISETFRKHLPEK
jgi:hypothetical protein